jgi:hypothetical protein
MSGITIKIRLSYNDLEDLEVINEWARKKLSISSGSKQQTIQIATEIVAKHARKELGYE